MSLLSNQRVSSGRILVVDDDEGARDLIVSSLRADGHDVESSSSGLEALRLVAGGAVRTAPLITHRFRLDRIDEAFTAHVDAAAIKVALEI